MPNEKDYDMNFRPKTYWVYSDLKERIRATVKGDARRLLAEYAIDDDFCSVPYESFNFKESLPEEELRSWSAIHPALMGGEFLPSRCGGEVEIARVSMESVTGDVISVRARWKRGKIHFAVVDEYDTSYRFKPKSSKLPLTLEELIALIDSAKGYSDNHYTEFILPQTGLILPPLEDNYMCGEELDNLRRFIKVSSAFYPSLGHWYDKVCEEWCSEKVLLEKGDDQ
jgi:hypothetical protein